MRTYKTVVLENKFTFDHIDYIVTSYIDEGLYYTIVTADQKEAGFYKRKSKFEMVAIHDHLVKKYSQETILVN